MAERGIDATEADGGWHGDGSHARSAWAIFQTMAAEPVNEPFDSDGEQLHVHYDDDDLLLFESFVERSREGSRPEVFKLSFTRQFGFHTAELEYFGMNAVWLDIDFPAEEALRELPEAQIWGRPPQLQEWVAKVEASPAFGAFAMVEPLRFYASQSDI